MTVDDPTIETDAPSPPAAVSPAGGEPATGTRRRLPRPLTAVVLLAAVFFALGSIGSPLLGRSVFAGTDELSTRSPYYDAGYADTVVQNTYTDDTYTSLLPNTLLFTEELRDGHLAQWNPYISGGQPLGSNINYALLNPLTLPYYVLPGWLAPAYEKLLEISFALLGAFLLLRRLRLGRAAALLGGTVYASTAFMIVWTNWPQTRVAAFIPWVFWAVERLVQRRGPVDPVLLAIPVACMLLGGFPAVTAYTLLTAAGYLVIRAVAEYRGQIRRLLTLFGGAVAAVLGGIALAGVQLLPFTAFYRAWLIEGRAQTPADHLSLTELATVFAPWTFGGVQGQTTGKPYWYLPNNMVEALSYLGAAAAVLVIVAVALAGPARRLLPRAAYVSLLLATGGWLLLIYVGGPLRLLQHLPVFSNNFIGRARSGLGLLLAVLAAVGFELLLRQRGAARATIDAADAPAWSSPGPAIDVDGAPTPSSPGRWSPGRWNLRRWSPGRWWGVGVWTAAALVLAVVIRKARHTAGAAAAHTQPGHADPLRYATGQLAIGLAFAALAVLAVATLYWSPAGDARRSRVIRFGAAAALPALIAVQALSLTVPYYPRVPRDTFYPETDVQAYLAANLGHQRFAGTWTALFMGSESARRLRALSGHGFMQRTFATLVRGVPDTPIGYPTYINFTAAPKVAQSPILDILGTRYFITSPRDDVFGTAHPDHGDGGRTALAAGTPVTVPVPTSGPLRAVGFTPAAGYGTSRPAESYVEVTVRDANGTEVATGKRLTTGLTPGQPFLVPVAAEQVSGRARLTATITTHTDRPLTVATRGGALAVSSVSGGGDGLALVHAGSSEIWERLTAQPRIRWASQVVTQADPAATVSLLATGTVAASAVVLAGAGHADGRPATVQIGQDGTDAISTTVEAQGAGYLVVADADQTGWVATVDGKRAPLVPADVGLVAVPVPAGRHTVALRYASPYDGAGAWISVIAVAVMIGAAGADWLWRRRADAAGERTRELR